MKINIFGSTGIIGKKVLKIIDHSSRKIDVNLLTANSNLKSILSQIKKFKPKYVHLNNEKKLNELKKYIDKKTKILDKNDLSDYLSSSKSDFTILAISGYNSLNFFDEIVNNTKNLGIVSKEAIVSGGHLFKKNSYFKKTNIYPLDSEHFSLYTHLNLDEKNKENIKNILITASGGPFYKYHHNNLKNITFEKAIKHPKWKMGYKNSIDSATLVNKCLEVIEAHYLFNIPYEKINILIHPEAIVHSIIQYNNLISNMILFKNDMSIPIYNFLYKSQSNLYDLQPKLFYDEFNTFNFFKVNNSNFPIYKYFKNLDKNNPSNLIKFNIGNEFAVNLFKNNRIKYTDIYKIIKKVGCLNLYSPLNTIKDIIIYHEEFEKILQVKFKKLL